MESCKTHLVVRRRVRLARKLHRRTSRQLANVTVGADGKTPVSEVAVSVTEQDRYEVKVEVYEGARLVAAQTLRHPPQ